MKLNSLNSQKQNSTHKNSTPTQLTLNSQQFLGSFIDDIYNSTHTIYITLYPEKCYLYLTLSLLYYIYIFGLGGYSKTDLCELSFVFNDGASS